jgi:2-keto-3-deoxygluconate permease
MAVAAADPRFLPFVASASAQTATAVLVTAILAPLVASWVLRRAGGLTVHDPVPEIAASKADPEVQLAG